MSIAPNALRKHFNEEELFAWKAKKVRNVKIEHARIHQINKARKKSKPLLSHKQITQDNPAKAKLLKQEKLMSNGYEVLFKITSNAKNLKQLTNHINYISREGSMKLLDSNLQTYADKSELSYCIENYQNGSVIPNENANKRERRETYNMVFSMRDYDDCDSKSLQIAAFKTIKTLYPNAYFTLAFHNDTDNPHCHICLKATNYDGSRIDIKKADCTTIRKTFAKNLNERGIYALATKRSDSIRGLQIASKITEKIEPTTLHEYKSKPHYYRVLDFGEAPYNDDNLNKMSYFVSYYTRKGNVTIWGENLKKIVEDSKLQKGEFARIAKIGYELRPYSFDKKIKGKIYTISSARKVAKWDISILNRAEKELIRLPKVKIKTTMALKEHLTQESDITKNGVKEIDSINLTQNLHNEKILQHKTKRYTRKEWANYYANKKKQIHNKDSLHEVSKTKNKDSLDTTKTQTKQERNGHAKPTYTQKRYTREEWARFKAEQKRTESSRATTQSRTRGTEYTSTIQSIQSNRNATKRTHAEQRARFYAKQRNATLHKSNAPAFRDSPKSYANLCGMPQSNVAYSKQSPRENNQVLLPNNAQHNLSGTMAANINTRDTGTDTREEARESKKRNTDRAL